MKSSGFRKSGEIRDRFELPKQLPDDFAGILASTQLLHLLQDPAESRFGLFDRRLGVILPVLLQASMVLLEFFAEELGEALAGRPIKRSGRRGVDGG